MADIAPGIAITFDERGNYARVTLDVLERDLAAAGLHVITAEQAAILKVVENLPEHALRFHTSYDFYADSDMEELCKLELARRGL